jgi:phage terminase large subunit-like protein
MHPRTKSLTSSGEWAEILRLIPGYDSLSTSGDCEFDLAEADRCIMFFERLLCHAKGLKAKKAFLLEPWQKAILANMFGWRRPNGTRRYRECLIYVPRKNGKSLLAAGIANYMLFGDGEQGSEIYCAASDREQASLLFDVARAQVMSESTLSSRADVFQKSIVVKKSNSSFKAISADASSAHGFNSHCVIVDELHAQPNRELVDVLMTSTGARAQPLVVHLTTADYAQPSICNEKYEYACKVRDGIIDDPSFLPVIYEALPDDDWTDPAVWRKANPNLGVSITEEYLARECQRAKETPTYENTFKRLHLNLRTEQDVRWIPMDAWDSCGDCPVDAEALEGEPAFMGVDLSSNRDITAVVTIFPRLGGYDVIPAFFVPLDTAEQRERKDRVPYATWIREGWIHGTPGNYVDYEYVEKHILDTAAKCHLKGVGFDPFLAKQIMQRLQAEGLPVVEFRQNMVNFCGPSKELERLWLSRSIRHGGHPVLRWMASNVTAYQDCNNNIRPDKAKSVEKIDGIVALLIALGLATTAKETPESVYATRGVTVL